MKQSTKALIEDVCESDLSVDEEMGRAQKVLRNIKPLREAMERECTDMCPFWALENAVKSIVKKYKIYNGQIVTITDIKGGMSYHGGCTKLDETTKKHAWLFTVHSDTMYGYFVKLVLMALLTAKEGQLPIR